MAINKIGIDEINLIGKRVMIRANLNVPLKNGKIVNREKITSTLETVQYALDKGASYVIILAHIGHPSGMRIKDFSLAPVAADMKATLTTNVVFMDEVIGDHRLDLACAKVKKGAVILLENIRFYAEEDGVRYDKFGNKKAVSPERIMHFRQSIKQLADVFVNNDFATSHKAYSSIMGEGFAIKVAGLDLKNELRFYNTAIYKPRRPCLAILGGVKVNNKIIVIKNLLNVVNEMIIAGGLAFTFLKHINKMDIGDSTYDRASESQVQEIISYALEKNVNLYFPFDFIIGDRMDDKANVDTATVSKGIHDNWMGLDIGPTTITFFREPISVANFILWNGPMGVYENKRFANGTKAIVEAVTDATRRGAVTAISGNDLVYCVTKWKRLDQFSHVSTGGASSLLLLQGTVPPGIVTLNDK